MIFRQLFDSTSGTYTYLLASRHGGEALIIDPVLERVDRYLQLVRELDLKLVKAVDTHLHADHVTGLGALRDRTHCITVMGEQTNADVVSMRVAEGDRVEIEGVRLDVLYTPGHTDDSYSFLLDRPRVHRRHAADPRHRPHRFPERRPARAIQFHLQQADETARRDAGLSGARLQRRYRLDHRRGEIFQSAAQVKSIDEYVDLMNNLKLPNPKMMDVAVPANMRVGLRQEEIARKGWAFSAAEAMALCGRRRGDGRSAREERTREARRHSRLAACALSDLESNIGAGGMLHELAAATGKRIVFYCAFGERSAMAVQAAQDAGLHRPVTSRAASTPGRRPRVRCCGNCTKARPSRSQDLGLTPCLSRGRSRGV